MILSVTLNPSVDRAVFVEKVKWNDTNRVVRTETDAGGKGVNLSRVASELGAETLATGFLGGGPGAYIKQILDQQGVRHEFVEVSDDTRMNLSIEDESDLPPTTLNEAGPQIEHSSWLLLLSRVDHFAKAAKWVALGGSLPPGLPVDAYRDLAEIARTHSAKVVLDADGDALRFGLKAKPNFIKPNAKEASRFLNREVMSLDDAVIAAREMLPLVAENGFVIVSMGELGAVLVSNDETWLGIPPKVDVRSTIGSGDSLIGGVLAALESGSELDAAFAQGIAAGAATAMTDGSSIARRDVVEQLINEVIVTNIPPP